MALHQFESEARPKDWNGPQGILASQSLDAFMLGNYLPRGKEYKRSWKIDLGIYQRHVQAILGHIALDKLTPENLMGVHRALEAKGFKESSIMRIMALLKAALNYAVKQGILSDSPARKLKAYAVPPWRDLKISAEDLARIKQALWDSPDNNCRAILLLMHLGSHMSETLALRWEDVNLDQGTITMGGYGRKRMLPIHEDVAEILAAIPRGESPWLFPGKDGGHMCNLFHTWWKTRKPLGLEHIQLRDLEMILRRFLRAHGHTRKSMMRILELEGV